MSPGTVCFTGDNSSRGPLGIITQRTERCSVTMRDQALNLTFQERCLSMSNTNLSFSAMCPSMLKRIIYPASILALLLAHSPAQARPSVSGNTITVPNNGWYQFQSEADYSTVCQGVNSCEVPAGSYLVVNHSTGERFDNIRVNDSSDGVDTITVDGNTISWPDDGWYQVQTMGDFSSICSGGRSCEVEPGNYLVINHSTGQRFSGITVDADSPGTGSSGITLSGNTISWTGSDWFQVQSNDDFSTVCEGGSSCTVTPGIYNIINLTSGTRIEGFVVEGDGELSGGSGSAPSTPPNLRATVYSDNQAELFWSPSIDDGWVMGYDVIRNGERVATLLDANSFFEGTLNAGTTYSYQVIAIDDNGNGESLEPPSPRSDTLPAAQAPIIDAANQVSWSFAPQDSDLSLLVEPYVVMPLASNGQPARWNDLATLGDRIFVVDEQDGHIYEISNRIVTLWFDVGAAVLSSTGRSLNTENPFHGGVRGIAFHPDFESNGKLYTSLLEERPVDTSSHHYISDAAAINADSVLVEWTADTRTMMVNPTSYREVFRVGIPEYDHPIKQIEFDPSASPGDESYGLLYIAHGDGSIESTTAVGGQGNNALGKILRVNPLATTWSDYTVPGSNPFVGDTTMIDEAYSIGHRNPHHLAFTNDGTLIVTEDGRDNIDEVNIIYPGRDYGWSQREGAFVQLERGSLAWGVDTLPADDADNDFTYPAAQFGHTGTNGVTFTGQALGGGFLVENSSELDGQFFYIDFPKSGEVFHSSMESLNAAVTQGPPNSLTVAKTLKASIKFDHDNNSDTPAWDSNLKEIIQSGSGYDGSGRVDVRYGQGPKGELYLLNKRNNIVYLVSNSLPHDDMAGGGEVGTGKPAVDTGIHGYDVWDEMSASTQALFPSDCLLDSAQSGGPFYCFSPDDRRLMRATEEAGITWQFPLPGENSSNHMESINFVNGIYVAIIADATPSPDDSAFDMSIFEQTGNYIGTYHIIPDIENPFGVDFAGVNLDGLNLIVEAGPTRVNAEDLPVSERWTNDLYIYAEHYSEIPGSDATVLSGWKKEGAFRVRLDSRNGNTLDTKLFPGITAAEALTQCPVPQSLASPSACGVRR